LPGRDADQPLPEPGAELPLPRRGDGLLPKPGAEPPLPRRGDGLLSEPGAEPPLPRRGDGLLPEPGAQPPLPRRGDSPLPPWGGGAIPGRENGSMPARDSGSLPTGDNGSVPGRDGEPERVFGAPIAGLANGLAAAPAGRAENLPGAEPDSAFSLGPWSNSAVPEPDTFPGEVNLPSALPAGEESRLPIFESVESDWFRRSRQQTGSDAVQEQDSAEIARGWESAADEGWRAAEAAESPVSGGVTSAGLPRRIPRANLVPGGVADADRAQPSGVARSAAATRERLASFQRGAQRGRAALSGEDAPGGEDEDAP
jgi:hypothetical protein